MVRTILYLSALLKWRRRQRVKHAHQNTVYHCLYGYYRLGCKRTQLARLYNKSQRTISNWIKTYETHGVFERANTQRDRIVDVVATVIIFSVGSVYVSEVELTGTFQYYYCTCIIYVPKILSELFVASLVGAVV